MVKRQILYLTTNGLMEPLGQSQVLAYLKGLSKSYCITIISFERSADLSNVSLRKSLQSQCEVFQIRWLPQRFRFKPRYFTSMLHVLTMLWLALLEIMKGDVKLIHARSYIPSMVALILSRLTGIPFIFDMRALWIEELITAGRLRRFSLLHKIMLLAERKCLEGSASVVSLTHAAVDYLRSKYPTELSSKSIEVIPTCADLTRFVPPLKFSNQRRIGCLGTLLSGWFRLDWLNAFLLVATRQDPGLVVEITTRDNPDLIRTALSNIDHLGERLIIRSASADRVPGILQQQIASVMFFSDDIGKLGSSPTRMAEALGCGIPIVANAGIGDMARIISHYKIGVLVSGSSLVDMEFAWCELNSLLQDEGIASRCRQAAIEVFSLESGINSYSKIYSEICNK